MPAIVTLLFKIRFIVLPFNKFNIDLGTLFALAFRLYIDTRRRIVPIYRGGGYNHIRPH